jgi:Thrombospondin type 3 repeat
MRRGFVLGWIGLVAACYNPHPPTGAPCSTEAPCPISQQCIGDRCVGPNGGELDAGAADSAIAVDGAVDGAIDAGVPTLMDRDGDGVANDMDNCPDTANPDQGDEDGDLIGDACDPCPIDPSTADPDGDGVAGICDPHPNTAGDKIVVFDGFHRPLPASWTLIGSPTQTGDDMVLSSVGGNHATVVPPLGMVANGMIMAAVTVSSNIASLDSAIAISQPYDPDTDDGVFCELDQSMGTTAADRFVSLYEALPADTFLGTRALPWVIGTQYRISLIRSGTNYACAFAFNGGATQTTSGMTTKAVALAKAAISVYNATASAAWILVVSSP